MALGKRHGMQKQSAGAARARTGQRLNLALAAALPERWADLEGISPGDLLHTSPVAETAG